MLQRRSASRSPRQSLRCAGHWPAGHPSAETILFADKHNFYMVARTPPDATSAPESTRLPLEVYAWPRRLLGGGRTAFFFSSDGVAAYSRNLVARYAGVEVAPRPGAARPQRPTPPDRPYRGRDQERWIPLPGRS